jgi:hypothetical protein
MSNNIKRHREGRMDKQTIRLIYDDFILRESAQHFIDTHPIPKNGYCNPYSKHNRLNSYQETWSRALDIILRKGA